jgi:hypothetical protein
MNKFLLRGFIALGAVALPLLATASSHREAPDIAGRPRVDGTDFYMFRSYEPGFSNFVTFIANYIPLQEPYGGPNFFNLDTNAIYEILVDNNGDAKPDWIFQFRFSTAFLDVTVPANGKQIPVPLINIGPIDDNNTNLNVSQHFKLEVLHGNSDQLAQNLNNGGNIFYVPADNIGMKSIADYAHYSQRFVHSVGIPGCATPGRVFVGQRKEGFVANLGEIFDLVNTNPVGPRDGEPNSLSGNNVTSIALEVPIACLTSKGDPVIGAWTTASLPSASAPGSATASANPGYTQVSRLGMPLVNEVVIGLPDKDKFNGSSPSGDTQFLTYVTNPSLPVILNALFGNAALIPGSPRNDLVATFLTGIKGLNQPLKVTPGEMLRLNTAIAPTPVATQKDLGVLGGDTAGFPNGRRPFDDVIDITLRVAEGALCSSAVGTCGSQTSDPNHGNPYTDGARSAGPDAAHLTVTGAVNAGDTYLDQFPYLMTPIAASPNGVAH